MTRKKLFLNYATGDPEDVAIMKNLRLHLGSLRQSVESWSPDMMIPGDEKDPVIEERFRDSDAVLHLLSVQFDNADECQHLLKKSLQEKKKVVPILLSSFFWQANPLLTPLEDLMLPRGAKPLNKSADSREAFTHIISVIAKDVLGLDVKVNIRNDRWIYYTTTVLVLSVGLFWAFWVQRVFHQPFLTLATFLMFGFIAVFVLSRVWFPTGLSLLK